ncbi:MAG: xanthine dehydrogenase family protein subunit M [Chloroflexota bacterium]|nr:xanthine dehydrogenase family protein subunit M [Chloroflexota bacterium]
MRDFEYPAPKTLEEAVALLERYGATAKLMAGGTDLVIMLNDHMVAPEHVVDVKGVPELNRFAWNPERGLTIGASVPFRRLETSAEVQQYYPGMYEAASEVGSWQIRNQATPVGNLCTASPACEVGPIMYALDATVQIAGPRGRRTLPIQQFITGVRRTALEPNEMVVDIQVPPPGDRAASHYIKLKERQKMDIAFVGVAATVALEPGDGVIREARIALGAVAPTPIRAAQAESSLRGQKLSDEVLEAVGRAAAESARPIMDVRASVAYRTEMISVLTKRAVRQAATLASQR